MRGDGGREIRLLEELGVPAADLHILLQSRIEHVESMENRRKSAQAGFPVHRPVTPRLDRKMSVGKMMSFTQLSKEGDKEPLPTLAGSTNAVATVLPQIANLLRGVTGLRGKVSNECSFLAGWNDLMLLQVRKTSPCAIACLLPFAASSSSVRALITVVRPGRTRRLHLERWCYPR